VLADLSSRWRTLFNSTCKCVLWCNDTIMSSTCGQSFEWECEWVRVCVCEWVSPWCILVMRFLCFISLYLNFVDLCAYLIIFLINVKWMNWVWRADVIEDSVFKNIWIWKMVFFANFYNGWILVDAVDRRTDDNYDDDDDIITRILTMRMMMIKLTILYIYNVWNVSCKYLVIFRLIIDQHLYASCCMHD